MTTKLKVYIAAGWFDQFQEEALTYIEEVLEGLIDIEVFSPRKEVKLEGKEGKELQEYVFSENVKHIRDSDLVVASTVGKDMGTLFETGYAYAKGVPIVYTFFDKRFSDAKFNLMLARSGKACYTDKEHFKQLMIMLNNEGISAFQKIEEYEGEFE